jgi:hypothetical protein
MPRTRQHLSPYELMFDKNPSADHLKVVGCSAHVHIPRKLRDKTEPVSKKGLFVGYAEFSRAWRVLIWRSNKYIVIESASVAFAEHLSASLQSLKRPPTDSNTPDIECDTEKTSFNAGLVQLPPEAASADGYGAASAQPDSPSPTSYTSNCARGGNAEQNGVAQNDDSMTDLSSDDNEAVDEKMSS